MTYSVRHLALYVVSETFATYRAKWSAIVVGVSLLAEYASDDCHTQSLSHPVTRCNALMTAIKKSVLKEKREFSRINLR